MVRAGHYEKKKQAVLLKELQAHCIRALNRYF